MAGSPGEQLIEEVVMYRDRTTLLSDPTVRV